MDEVRVKVEEPLPYASRSKQLRAEEIDGFIRESLAELYALHPAAGPPFGIYRGCAKEDEQIVDVCLPTAAGQHEWAGGEVAYTIARGDECAYPAILGAYDAVVAFAAAAGRELAGPPREVYLSDDDANPVMEIAFPLAT